MRWRRRQQCSGTTMSRLDRYHDHPMKGGAQPPPPIPKKGILMSPPPPPPTSSPMGGHHSSATMSRQFNLSGPMSLPWGGTGSGGRTQRTQGVGGGWSGEAELPRKGPKVSPWGNTEPPSVLNLGHSGERIR